MKYIVMLLVVAGCGQRLPEPDITLDSGIKVYLRGQQTSDFTKPSLEIALELFKAEFPYRYDHLDKISVSFLPEDTYYLYGIKVAGNTSHDGSWIYVGAKTYRLWQGAFVHELVHSLDLLENGYTDSTHESWHDGTYQSIGKVNAAIKLELE